VKTTRTVVTLAAMAVLTMGCGADDTASTGSQAPASPSAATAAPPAARASQPAYAVTGVVRDTDGRPVPGTNVALTSLDRPANAVPEIAVLTDRAGRYQWPASVPPGRYQVHATTSAGTASAVVDLPAAGRVTADLTLRPA
jgi:protocatechuate 3,4-dioxygenase beta subunit